MESEFPVPIFGIRLTKTSLSLPVCVCYPESPFGKFELQGIASFDVSGFVRGSDNSLAADQFCVFVHDQIFRMYTFSDYNTG